MYGSNIGDSGGLSVTYYSNHFPMCTEHHAINFNSKSITSSLHPLGDTHSLVALKTAGLCRFSALLWHLLLTSWAPRLYSVQLLGAPVCSAGAWL